MRIFEPAPFDRQNRTITPPSRWNIFRLISTVAVYRSPYPGSVEPTVKHRQPVIYDEHSCSRKFNLRRASWSRERKKEWNHKVRSEDDWDVKFFALRSGILMNPICRMCATTQIGRGWTARIIGGRASDGIRTTSHPPIRKLKWNFQSIYDLKSLFRSHLSLVVAPGNLQYPYLCCRSSAKEKKGLHASIKKHCWCSSDMCESGWRGGATSTEKVAASCQKHLWMMCWAGPSTFRTETW